MDEWRSQWHLAGQYADSTPDDLIHDMADIQPHVRLKAVATVTKAVTYKPPQEPGIQIETERGKLDPVSELPVTIFRALEYLLGDKHSQVKRAAAIALFSLNKPNPQVRLVSSCVEKPKLEFLHTAILNPKDPIVQLIS